jgi:hypothetical protein
MTYNPINDEMSKMSLAEILKSNDPTYYDPELRNTVRYNVISTADELTRWWSVPTITNTVRKKLPKQVKLRADTDNGMFEIPDLYFKAYDPKWIRNYVEKGLAEQSEVYRKIGLQGLINWSELDAICRRPYAEDINRLFIAYAKGGPNGLRQNMADYALAYYIERLNDIWDAERVLYNPKLLNNAHNIRLLEPTKDIAKPSQYLQI